MVDAVRVRHDWKQILGVPPAIVTVLVPAWNEGEHIAITIGALKAQIRPPDRIIVVADNCTDNTIERAEGAGAEIFETVGNSDKKGGALNQALAALLPDAKDEDVFLIQDADSVLAPRWLSTALPQLQLSEVGAVGGIFYTPHRQTQGFIGELQRLEYVRYARQIARHNERAYVLTGTATALRADVLRELANAYTTGRLPGGTPGKIIYYVESSVSITEDSFMTFAVKSLGYKTPSPMECWVCTDVMGTWTELWAQRIRWQRGALENLRVFGVTRVTYPYALRQLLTAGELLSLIMFASITAWSIMAGVFHIQPFWLGISSVFIVERIVSVRKAGRRAMLLAATMIPETFYGLWKHAVNIAGIYGIVTGSETRW
jgi:biofilm PGA synthesis N-glycosyltransferase PgaC